MVSALYYPHTQIKDERLLKNSLLLWDQVEYIVPQPDWKHVRMANPLYNDAIDIITVPHHPNTREKEFVHNRVQSLVDKGIPDWFFLNRLDSRRRKETYAIYPEKLSHETWRLMQSNRLAEFNRLDNDFHVAPLFGLMVMSLLADACAGTTKRKITDRADAYAWLMKFNTAELGRRICSWFGCKSGSPCLFKNGFNFNKSFKYG